MTAQEKMWKNDIRRVYHWFQPKYDEKKGGLLPRSPYHCVMEEAFRVYHQKLNVCLEQIDEINRFSEQMNDLAAKPNFFVIILQKVRFITAIHL